MRAGLTSYKNLLMKNYCCVVTNYKGNYKKVVGWYLVLGQPKTKGPWVTFLGWQ
jgi:hypothetical protein